MTRTRKRSHPELIAATFGLMMLLLGGCSLLGDEVTLKSAGSPSGNEIVVESSIPDEPAPTTPQIVGRALVTATTIEPIAVTPPSTLLGPDTVPLIEVPANTCVNIPEFSPQEQSEVDLVVVVDCEEPHLLEVYWVGSLNDEADIPYPGDNAVITTADEWCLSHFEHYVGVPYVEADLEIVHLRPNEQSWQRGDRSVLCALSDPDLEHKSGSAQGQ